MSVLAVMACSDNNDSNDNTSLPDENAPVVVDAAPVWKANLQMPESGVVGKPDWQWNRNDFFQHEENMTAIVHIGDALNFLSSDDRMAALVGGQVRDIAEPVPFGDPLDEPSVFMLYIPFSAGDGAVELQYYNAKSNRTYTMADAFTVNDDRTGVDTDFLFNLFPFISVIVDVPANGLFTYTPDDQVAVFADDVCCSSFLVFGTEDVFRMYVRIYTEIANGAKTLKVRYYNAANKTIYTKVIDMPADWATLTLKFGEH